MIPTVSLKRKYEKEVFYLDASVECWEGKLKRYRITNKRTGKKVEAVCSTNMCVVSNDSESIVSPAQCVELVAVLAHEGKEAT